ncbi:MAG: hypothetical protein KUG77_06770 [Nannocystaceae bacterium]|nr:hypothetical protein [Nannocystaceae bacterium]
MLSSSIVIASVLVAPARLGWNAPGQCPSEADVRARVERYLGDAVEQDSVPAQADVTEREEGGWLLVLTTTDASGTVQTREIEDADCEGLAETAAVLTALAVAPQVDVVAEPEPAAEPVTEVPPVPAQEPEPEVETSEPPPREPIEAPLRISKRRVPLRYGLRLGGGIGIGWLPLGGDVGLAGTIGGRWWAAELEGLFGVPRSVRLGTSPDVGADLLGWSVAGRGCGVLPLTSWLALPLCVGLEGGQVRATSVGLEDSDNAALPWVAGLASASLRAQLHPRLALWLMPELQVGIRRPQFYADGGELDVFAASLASGRARAGLEFVF